jgi:hypothetical protein
MIFALVIDDNKETTDALIQKKALKIVGII